MLEELASVADSPGQQVDLLLDELLWPDQPLGWDVAGTRESIEGLTREMIMDYMARQYVPNNIVVAVAGNIGHDRDARADREPLRGRSASGSPAPGSRPATARRRHAAASSTSARSSHTSPWQCEACRSSTPTATRSTSRVLFGESMSSRLFMELRERQGLCYDVHSYVSHFLDTGSFGVYAAVDPSRGREAVVALIGEMVKLRDGIPEEELRKAKELAKGRVLLRMEDTRAVSGWLGGQEMLTNQILSPEDVVERIEAVTPADVTRVIDKILVRKNLNLAIVGPYRSDKRFLPLLDI